jgi:hypothetical protein
MRDDQYQRDRQHAARKQRARQQCHDDRCRAAGRRTETDWIMIEERSAVFIRGFVRRE